MYPSYTYLDGSANRYSINTQEVQYVPVKPEFSSSGFYDGGPAWKVNITSEQFEALEKLFEGLIADTSKHIAKRLMGSGKITKRNHLDQSTTSYLIDRRATFELVSFLQDLAPKEE